jgi:CubicO group peptidase (beta-lactamase class C family)
MKDTGTPGVAVGVMHRGRAYAQGFGITSLEAPAPVDENTLFQIGSTTKTYTATAIMRLVEKKELDLDRPVRRYLRDLKLKDPDVTKKVTLRHLLTHTGGWAGDFFPETGRGEDAVAKLVGMLPKIPQLTPLGEVWHYNNAGFVLAGRVLEKVTGQTYEQAVKELVVDPLGMTRSFFFPEEAIVYSVAAGHVAKTFRSRQHSVATPYALMRSSSPSGAIISDVVDQLRWAQFNLGDGRSRNGTRLLKKSTMRMMQTPQRRAGGFVDHIGISWLISDLDDGTRLVAHGGTTNGHLSAFVMVPERNFTVTVLTNSSRGGEVHRAAVDRALELYLGLESNPPKVGGADGTELERYAGRYVDAFKTWGIELEPSGRRLKGDFLVFDNPDDDPVPPSFHLAFFEPDRVLVQGGRLGGLKAEFLRDKAGRVQWLHYGGRILRRSRST